MVVLGLLFCRLIKWQPLYQLYQLTHFIFCFFFVLFFAHTHSRNEVGSRENQNAMRISAHLGVHAFQEYTYKKITACDVCREILRGTCSAVVLAMKLIAEVIILVLVLIITKLIVFISTPFFLFFSRARSTRSQVQALQDERPLRMLPGECPQVPGKSSQCLTISSIQRSREITHNENELIISIVCTMYFSTLSLRLQLNPQLSSYFSS